MKHNLCSHINNSQQKKSEHNFMTQLLIKELKMQLPRKLIILLIKFSPYINLIAQSMKINN